jgi:hypothetical protein
VCSVAIKIVDKGEFVCVSECVTLEALGEAVERAGEHHGAVADLVFPTRQTEGVHFDGAFGETLLVGQIAVV